MTIPSTIGRYEIKSELGRGGMATVYRGYDSRFDRDVAIKVLPREMLHDPQFRSRFERELKIVAGLEHPAIVPVYDVGEEDGQPYFVMRYMTGGSLASEIDKGNFSTEDTARIIGKIAQGLAYAHKKGIIHRDLKPDNILFDDAGEPFISDFGVAKFSGSSGSLTGSGIIGTPAYMSPEQAQGNEIDSRSDVYGLGVIAYQMLTGKQPYESDTPMGVVVKHITEPVPEILKVMPSLPAEVDTLIKRALAKDREKRYQSTIDLAKGLNMIAFGNEGNLTSNTPTGMRTGVFRDGTATSAARPPSRSLLGPAIGGAVVLVALVGFFLLRSTLFPPQVLATASAPAATLAPTSAPTSAPIQAPPASVPAPATSSLSSPLPFAPVCAPNVGVPRPQIDVTDKVCIKKVPYTYLSIPAGDTFESTQPQFTCQVDAQHDGKTFLSCTGKQLFSFDLKICQPLPAPGADAGRCPSDSAFDSANQCCIPPRPQGGCIMYKVDIRGCP